MQKLVVLIVDDSTENLEAAKQAAENFPEHEFRFTNSAKEAVGAITETDAVITDLFFPDEGHADGGELDWYYSTYRSKMLDNPAFSEVVRSYYDGKQWKAEENLDNALALLEDGTIRRAVEGLVQLYDRRARLDQYFKKYADEYRERLRNLPASQFPYGGALILRAKELGKRHCLVSDIHRHAGDYKDAPSAIDGMVLLLPLMGEGIISVEQVKYDGRESLTYLGSDEVHHTGKGKNDPVVWTEAIRRTLAQ